MSHLRKEELHLPNVRLRQARLQRGWSQLQLADQLGTTIVTVKRWERGSQSPSPYFRLKLCALFGLGDTELGLGQQEAEEDIDTLAQQKPLQSTSSPSEEGPFRNTHVVIIKLLNPPKSGQDQFRLFVVPV